jgi:hypothetical protein
MNATSPMNDDEVLAAVRRSLTAVRDALEDVHMERPVEELVAQGRTRRARRARRALAVRAAVACGTAAVTVAVIAMTGGASGTPARTAPSGAQARAVAFVVTQVTKALASENLVFVGHTTGSDGPSVTWAYGLQNRFEEFWPSTDYRGRLVNGHRLWDFPPKFRGQPSLTQGTALIGGKLTYAYVTYPDHLFSLYTGPAFPPPRPCSTTSRLSMGGPPSVTYHWSDLVNATLACGAATVTGHVRINGVETTKITGTPVTVRLPAGEAKAVRERWVRARWTLYVNPTTYLPVRMSSSTQTYGGSVGSTLSSAMTDVQWLPPTAANIAKTLVTIPAGFHQLGWEAHIVAG